MKIKIVKSDKSIKQYLPIFATKEFLETKSDSFAWIVSDDFILPFYIDKRAIFSKLVFTTETIVLNESADEEEFLNSVVAKVKELDVDFIAQPMANVLFRFVPKNSKYIKWGSYVVDLNISEEDILKNMHSKHRNVIRKAIKDGVIVEETQDISLIYENLKETMQRQNRAYSSVEELEKIKSIAKFYIAKKDEAIQGCAVLSYNCFGAYYLYGGSIARPYTGALNYLHYYAMLDMKKNGVQKYDFMGARLNVEKGSKLEGIQRFKSRFGGELKEGYLWKYEYKPTKIKIIDIIQKTRYKLQGRVYLGDAIEQESNRCQN